MNPAITPDNRAISFDKIFGILILNNESNTVPVWCTLCTSSKIPKFKYNTLNKYENIVLIKLEQHIIGTIIITDFNALVPRELMELYTREKIINGRVKIKHSLMVKLTA
jgi:hypothetical protein